MFSILINSSNIRKSDSGTFDISLEKLFERPYSEDQTGSHDSDYNNQMFIKINECLEKGEPVVVGLEPLFKLEKAEGNNVEMSNPEASHSVLVIGTTPDGKLIVTSWGWVYTVDMAYVYVAATYTY